MISTLKTVINSLLHPLGFDIRRYRPGTMAKLVTFLDDRQVIQVLDVGANIGQYAKYLRKAGYRGRILSFEPLSEAHAVLSAEARKDRMWDVAPRCAVGDKAGEIAINVSNNSVSSSVLPMLQGHEASAPESVYVGSESITLVTLDNCEQIDRSAISFLKVDTQGYEQHVLNGASQLISRLAGLQLELSFAELYAGQADFVQITEDLIKAGFEIWDICPGFSDPDTGRLLQADAIFMRPL